MLNRKYQTYVDIADEQTKQITQSMQDWTGFLKTAGRLYKYPFEEQMMIHAQRPDAIACAPFETWNKPMNRYIKRGSKGIALFDNSQGKGKLKYVFDVMDTQDGRYNPHRPFLWQLEQEHNAPVLEALDKAYDISTWHNPDDKLGDTLYGIAATLATRYYEENAHDILFATEGSHLEGLDESGKCVAFVEALIVSTAYTLMSRCGLDPTEFISNEDFQSVFDFNTPESVFALGKAVSVTSEDVLREIEVTIKKHERQKAAELEGNEHERSNSKPQRNNILPMRGLSDTRHNDTRTDGGIGEVRNVEEGLSEQTQGDSVLNIRNEGNTVPPLSGNREASQPTVAADSGELNETNPAAEQGSRPDGLHSTHGESEIPSGGNNNPRTDLQLDQTETTETPQFQQIPLFPTEEQQHEIIDSTGEREAQALFSAPPQLVTITQDDIDQAITAWNGDIDSKIRVLEYMYEHARARDTAKFLKEEYGGTGIFTVTKDEAEPIELPWAKVQRRIGQLMDEDNFLVNDERNLADSFLEAQWNKIKAENSIPAADEPQAQAVETPPEPEVIAESKPESATKNEPNSPPPVFFVDWKTAQLDFDVKLYQDRDVIGYNKDGVEYAVGRMGDLTYITNTTGITPWGQILGQTNIPRDIWEQMNAYRNGNLSNEDVRANYLNVLESHKQDAQADVSPQQPEELQSSHWDKDTQITALSKIFGVDKNLLHELTKDNATEQNVNEFGRFDRLMATVDFTKAKNYFEEIDGNTLTDFRVKAKVYNLLNDFVVSGEFNVNVEAAEREESATVDTPPPEQDTAADYALSYRFLSDPDRIIVFNDIDPDEIDIVARVHADGSVVIVKENVPQSVIDELTAYGTDNFAGLKDAAEARLGRMIDVAMQQSQAFDELVGQHTEPEAVLHESLTADVTPSPTMAIADFVKSKLETGEKFTSAELFAEATKAYGDTMANNAFTPKDAYDAMELGVNQFMLSIDNLSHENVMNALDLLPTQTKRTTEMEKYQQFSTPPSIAYLANWAANVNANDTVLEPSAGIGGIAVFAKKDGATVFVNELDKRRLEIIKNLPFDGFFNEDAEQINNIHGDKLEPTVIVMNPPFSSSAERNIHDTKIGAKHIEESLKMLAPNGRLVAIVGQGMADDAPAFRSWWRDIKEQYNVKANIGVDGKNYSKYGTTFGIQMLVIDKTGATTEPVKTAFVENLSDLQNILEGVKNGRPSIQYEANRGNEQNPTATTRLDVASERQSEHKPVESVPNASGRTNPAVGGDRHGQTVTSEVSTILGGTATPTPESANISNDGLALNVNGGRDSGNDGRNDVNNGTGRTGFTDNGQSIGSVEPLTEQAKPITPTVKPPKPVKTELTDSIFENYEPQPLLLQNVQPHPANISESAAMSAIQPPPVTYKPQLSQDIIDKGILSDVQLEAVTYAGQSHSQTLPNGNTRGFFLGDGTGVGKGRTITGVILDNFNQGSKKAVWVSENTGLVPDAKRDVKALFGNSDLVVEFKGGQNAEKSLSRDEAILFTTYSSMSKGFDQSGSNFEKIVNWLGKDFDGVIVFDEAHNMANSTASKGNRGIKKASQRGMAGLALQEALPNAKVIYSSATGATEVDNLRYAERLGLWGEGTAFPNGDNFVHRIKAGGLAAMELIARDMKAMGVYLSRNISYEDVAYDKIVHQLTPEQRTIYDELARSWQIVLKNLNQALKDTNQDKDGTAKGKAYGAFWSAEQRFFNQILTAMQVPSMIADIQKQLDNDNSIVIQLVSTNESAQEREFTRLQEQDLDLEDFDLTPKQMLMSYIENSFPTTQFEKYTDDNGNTRSKPVYDSEGKPVINREAVRQKEELLDKLGSIKVPASALDMIINHFGSDMVAENTGRKRRVVVKDGKAKEENIANKKQADVSAFQDGEKRIIVFSKAGGTGKSYHADKSAKNQQHRVHYLLQAGWQADAAVQGFGRSHRSNQVSSPTFALVTTDLKGQMRFISTIAKRLDQLGALTKGQRQTGSQGLFTAGDNLENAFAADVLAGFYKALVQNKVSDISDGTGIIEKLGLKDKILDEYGNIVHGADELREVNKFLNRILSLECHEQNAVFDGYAERLHIATEKAMQEGTLDKGLENYKADKVVLNEAHDIRADEATRATTKYYSLTAHDKIKPLQFDDVNTQNTAFMGFYQSKNTGAVRAVFQTSSMTDEHGSVIENCRLTGQDGNQYMPLNRLASNWTELTPEKAESLWNNAIDELPEFRTSNLHLIGGTVLPVWDKLPTENVRIYRVLTTDGDMLIGRVIPEELIDATLDKLGATREKEQIGTTDLIKHIKNGDTVHLDNGWKIAQRRVSNEQRIEIMGADYLHSDMLNKKGVFTERIGFNTRYFIPAEKDTAKILDEVLKISPVSRVERNKERTTTAVKPNLPERTAAKSDVAKGKPSMLEAIERYAEKSRATFGGGSPQTERPKTQDRKEDGSR